jgi:hypothetical protein
VAVPAVDAHAAYVVRMAELDGLIDEFALPGDIGGSHEQHHDPAEECDGRDDANETCFGQGIRASLEQLTHKGPEGVRAPSKCVAVPIRLFGL